MAAWIAAGHDVARLPLVSAEEVHERLSDERALRVLDVRSDEEWVGGHVCGALHVMGGYVPERAAELAKDDAELAVVCSTGYRSTVAASVLARAGATRLINVAGGMNAWRKSGLPECKPPL
jgi:hydroxyacylglutathione hydrolase